MPLVPAIVLGNPDRLAELERTGLADSPPDPAFDRLTGLVRRVLRVPVALVSLVDSTRQFFKSASGLPEPWATLRETPLTHSFCQWVVASGESLVVNDAREHPLVCDNQAISDLGVIAYLGIPIRAQDGHVLGSLAAIDSTARTWTEDDFQCMLDFASLVESEIELLLYTSEAASQKVRAEEAREQLARDIAGQRVAERKLLAMTVELKRSNDLLQEFASVAAHDLQEPLRKVQAFGDRLRLRAADMLDPEGKDYLDRMLGASGRMQTLIQDLLLYSRVTTHAQPFVPIDLNTVVASVFRENKSVLLREGAHVEIDSDLPTIEGDPAQMRQVFQNLVANAIKFRRQETPLRISVSAMDVKRDINAVQSKDSGTEIAGSIEIANADSAAAACSICFRDNGIGFEPQYNERIFEVFGKLNARDAYAGNGMGLAISRRIVERHGGTITADSELGEGSAFILTLPLLQSNSSFNEDEL